MRAHWRAAAFVILVGVLPFLRVDRRAVVVQAQPDAAPVYRVLTVKRERLRSAVCYDYYRNGTSWQCEILASTH